MKSKVFLIIGLSMFAFMTLFLLYAANHPTGSFPWPLTTTYQIYKIYIGVMVLSFLSAIVLKVINVLKHKAKSAQKEGIE